MEVPNKENTGIKVKYTPEFTIFATKKPPVKVKSVKGIQVSKILG